MANSPLEPMDSPSIYEPVTPALVQPGEAPNRYPGIMLAPEVALGP